MILHHGMCTNVWWFYSCRVVNRPYWNYNHFLCSVDHLRGHFTKFPTIQCYFLSLILACLNNVSLICKWQSLVKHEAATVWRRQELSLLGLGLGKRGFNAEHQNWTSLKGINKVLLLRYYIEYIYRLMICMILFILQSETDCPCRSSLGVIMSDQIKLHSCI